jgi:hypothetical protein
MASTLAHADLAYTFDTDAQGFTLNEAAAGELSHDSGGYLRVKDLTDQTNVQMVLPGAAVAGGWQGYEGGTLSFDARLEAPIASYWPQFGEVSLLGSQGNITVDIAPGDEPGQAWKTYSIKLDAASWGSNDSTFRNVLANLQSVQINLEAGNGAIETVHIDNVRVSAVPEPASLTLGLVGLMGLGMLLGANGLPARRKRHPA